MGKLVVKMLNEHYQKENDLKQLTAYIAGKGENQGKEAVPYIGANGVKREKDEAASQIIKVQKAFHKDSGRRAYHMVVSFPGDMKDTNAAIQTAKAIGDDIFSGYQVFYGVHTCTDNLHIHFAINAVSYTNGKKWHMGKGEFQEYKKHIQNLTNDVMLKNHLPELDI